MGRYGGPYFSSSHRVIAGIYSSAFATNPMFPLNQLMGYHSHMVSQDQVFSLYQGTKAN